MKPSEDDVSDYIKCPEHKRMGWLQWWLPEPEEKAAHQGELQLVMNHGKGVNQNTQGYRRNDFHYFKYWRDAEDGELLQSFRAWPEHRPLDDKGVRRFLGMV